MRPCFSLFTVRLMMASGGVEAGQDAAGHGDEEHGDEVVGVEVGAVVKGSLTQLSQMFSRGKSVTKMPMNTPTAENIRMAPKMG